MTTHQWTLFCCIALAVTGCKSEKPADATKNGVEVTKKNAEPVAKGIKADQLVGKWRLVRAGGQPPIQLYIKSQEIDLAADGTWTSRIEVQPPHRSLDIFHGKGTWSLADGVLACKYTPKGAVSGEGPDYGKSFVRLESGRLIVDPDCFMQARINGTPPVEGVYER